MTMQWPVVARLAVLSIVVAALGCASGGTGTTRDRDLIPRETIRQSTATDVYHLIRLERPSWLRGRGALTAQTGGEGLEDLPVVVYVDNIRFGALSDLAMLSTQGVTEIRRLSARDATQRFGTGHPRGAIVVSTRP